MTNLVIRYLIEVIMSTLEEKKDTQKRGQGKEKDISRSYLCDLDGAESYPREVE